MKISELLWEAPIAEDNELEVDEEFLPRPMGLPAWKAYWKVIDTIKVQGIEYLISYHEKSCTYQVGKIRYDEVENKEVFSIIFRIDLDRIITKGNIFGYDNLHHVKEVYTVENFRNLKIAKDMYRYLVHNEGKQLLGDRRQYFGARKLWVSL